jgi:hypothetical protein
MVPINRPQSRSWFDSCLHKLQAWVQQEIVDDDPWDVDTLFPDHPFDAKNLFPTSSAPNLRSSKEAEVLSKQV